MGRWAAKSSKTKDKQSGFFKQQKDEARTKKKKKKRREINLEVKGYEPGMGWGERSGEGSHVHITWLIHTDV